MRANEYSTSGAKAPSSNRRATYVINPSVQWRYALSIAAMVFLVATVLSSVLYGVLHHQARMRLINPMGYSAGAGHAVLFFALAFAFITAGGIGAWCIMMTHRMCGPMYVLEQHFKALADGRFPKMRDLRKKDEFKELYARFREAVDFMKSSREKELEAFNNMLESAKTAMDSDDHSCRQALESMACQMKEMRKDVCDSLGQEMDKTCEVNAMSEASATGPPVSVA